MSPSLDPSDIVSHVARGMGTTVLVDAQVAIRATIVALSEMFDEDTDRAFQAHLPASMRVKRHLPHAPDEARPSLFFERVAQEERVPAGFAREHAEVVCRVLGEAFDDEIIARIARAAPEIVPLFRRKDDESSPDPSATSRARAGHTLAGGRPGSAHPIATSAPRGAQAHSVAEANPHGETKLSSSSGLTQERRQHALANAEEELPERKISDAGD